MLKYIVRRLLLFIPTLITISLFTFFISVNAPGDPVDIILNRGEGSEAMQSQKPAKEKEYIALRHELGFDLPLFYFSLTDATVPDTLYKIPNPEHRATLKRLANEYGNWSTVSAFYLAERKVESDLFASEKNSLNYSSLSDYRFLINELFLQHDETKINLLVEKFSTAPLASVHDLKIAFLKLSSGKNPYRKYIPAIHWYGLRNQYHHWLVNFFSGDFGVSYQDKRPVSESLWEALPRTLGISLTSILLAYLIAIPLGVHSAIKKGTRSEKTLTTTLFLLYSLPNFWIATLLVIFLCGGDFLSWFPAPGSPPIAEDASIGYKLLEGTYRLLLPLFCWTYGSLAFVSRQMRGGILQNITQDYIQTARAKGLDEKKVIWKHALKNSLLPVITLFGSIFPLAISGSFVIETIFNIPGMGKLSLDALYSRDYPIIFSVMMFTAMLTLLGNLVSDILYALVDPRISYTKKP
ncbi:MAG: ABC transporter permease [Bacteroidetes bacterium]|nr:ABC transporter permease [Bacteroidota bacterium]